MDKIHFVEFEILIFNESKVLSSCITRKSHRSIPSTQKRARKILTLAKYLAGFSAHLKIVRRPSSKNPDVSPFTA
jgi:hypothetical protein